MFENHLKLHLSPYICHKHKCLFIPVMTGQRRVDPFAVKGLLDRGRIKQAKVGRQNQEYQRQGRDVNNTRQGRDVNNTRQKSGSQAQVQSSEVRGPRSEVRGPRSEVRGPRSEVRGPRSEVRGPRSEVRQSRVKHRDHN